MTDQVTLMGQPWQHLATLPRLLAEGWRRELEMDGIVSALLTPTGWSFAAPISELIGGHYLGDVGLYVPAAQHEQATQLLGLDQSGGEYDGDDWEAEAVEGARDPAED